MFFVIFTAFWFNIELARKSYRWQFFIFMENVSFSFSTFLVFGRPSSVSPKSLYQPQTSSKSTSEIHRAEIDYFEINRS